MFQASDGEPPEQETRTRCSRRACPALGGINLPSLLRVSHFQAHRPPVPVLAEPQAQGEDAPEARSREHRAASLQSERKPGRTEAAPARASARTASAAPCRPLLALPQPRRCRGHRVELESPETEVLLVLFYRTPLTLPRGPCLQSSLLKDGLTGPVWRSEAIQRLLVLRLEKNHLTSKPEAFNF